VKSDYGVILKFGATDSALRVIEGVNESKNLQALLFDSIWSRFHPVTLA
jgi:hypothetical protein